MEETPKIPEEMLGFRMPPDYKVEAARRIIEQLEKLNEEVEGLHVTVNLMARILQSVLEKMK